MRMIFSLVVLLFSQGALAVKGSCQESYVPPYTMELLQDVKDWAMGGALAVHAENAGVEFDRAAYMEDCPSLALFNFGRATATQCLEVDVLNGYASGVWVLDNYYRKSLSQDPEEVVDFQEMYLEKAWEWGFSQYILLPEE